MTPKFQFRGALDTRTLQRRSDRRNKRTLFRTGAYARKVLRSRAFLGRKTKKPSTVGEPPRAHWGQLKNLTTYAVDPSEGAVYAGPEIFASRNTRKTRTNQTIPDLLDSGGRAVVETDEGERVPIQIRPRPFVDKALVVAADRMADIISQESL